MSLPRSRHTYTLLVLVGINTMNFYDRQVLGAVAEPIKREWQLSDAQLGGLGTAFTLLYAAVGLPLGRWADLGVRKHILAAGVTLWSLLTAISGVAWNYWSLFCFRLGVGVGEASCAPAANSLLGDLYPAERRGRALSLFMFGLPLGLGLGFIVAGAMAKLWGWRAALLAAGLPGLALGALTLWINEPARGAAEVHAVGTARRPGSALLAVLRIPTMWWIIIAGALHNFNMYALGNFLSPYLIRYHGLDTSQAGLVAGICYGFSGGIGVLLGGWLCDWAARFRIGGRLEVSAGAILIFVPCIYLSLRCSPGEVWGFGSLLFVGCMASYAFYSGVYPAIQDIIEPGLRGTAMAVFFCAMYLLGASLGPVATGWASDHYARRTAGDAEVLDIHKAIGLRDAMGLIPLLALVLVVVLVIASRTVARDHARLQGWMRAGAE